jgi:DNA polymerase-3 subunit alpha
VDLCDRIDLRQCNKRVLEALIDAGACDSLDGHRAQLLAALEAAFGEAQVRQGERLAGQGALFGELADAPRAEAPLPDVPVLTEQDRLTREKAVLGFFISGHPLAKYRTEVELFGTRTTAMLGEWSDQKIAIAAVITAVKRQISRKSGAEYARLTLEDFHGTAEAIVFPEAWARLNSIIRPDAVLLLGGGHSPRDRGEDPAPFIVESAQPLDGLKPSGAIGLRLSCARADQSSPDWPRAVAALCAAHPGPVPVLIEWSEGNGGGQVHTAKFRSRSLRVDAADDLLAALRDLLGRERVQLVKAG